MMTRYGRVAWQQFKRVQNKDMWIIGLVWVFVTISRIVNLHEHPPTPSLRAWVIFTAMAAIIALGVNALLPNAEWLSYPRPTPRRQREPVALRVLDAVRISVLCALVNAASEFSSGAITWLLLVMAVGVVVSALRSSVTRGRRRQRPAAPGHGTHRRSRSSRAADR